MTGRVTGTHKGVTCIQGDDGARYYGIAKHKIKTGTEVFFQVNKNDCEVADNIASFGIRQEFTLVENIISAIIGLVIGIIAALLMVKPVHAGEISEADKSLLVHIVHAEAGNQDLLGRRLVADVVLNRVESEDFPDTIREVIYQPGQFTPACTGSINLKPDDMDVYAVELELNQRTNKTVLFFKKGGYHRYGEPHFKVGDHYFS